MISWLNKNIMMEIKWDDISQQKEEPLYKGPMEIS